VPGAPVACRVGASAAVERSSLAPAPAGPPVRDARPGAAAAAAAKEDNEDSPART
jgi:hypothetical protein